MGRTGCEEKNEGEKTQNSICMVAEMKNALCDISSEKITKLEEITITFQN